MAPTAMTMDTKDKITYAIVALIVLAFLAMGLFA